MQTTTKEHEDTVRGAKVFCVIALMIFLKLNGCTTSDERAAGRASRAASCVAERHAVTVAGYDNRTPRSRAAVAAYWRCQGR